MSDIWKTQNLLNDEVIKAIKGLTAVVREMSEVVGVLSERVSILESERECGNENCECNKGDK